jgi:hypothetical protein
MGEVPLYRVGDLRRGLAQQRLGVQSPLFRVKALRFGV